MAGQTKLTWIPGSKTYVSTDSTGHSVVLSTPKDNTGMKPSELLLSALAGCTSVDVVNILEKKQTPLTSLEIIVSSEQDKDPPWTFRNIHLLFRLKGKGLTEKNVRQAIDLSEEKYCSVASSLRGTVDITTSFVILDDEDNT